MTATFAYQKKKEKTSLWSPKKYSMEKGNEDVKLLQHFRNSCPLSWSSYISSSEKPPLRWWVSLLNKLPPPYMTPVLNWRPPSEIHRHNPGAQRSIITGHSSQQQEEETITITASNKLKLNRYLLPCCYSNSFSFRISFLFWFAHFFFTSCKWSVVFFNAQIYTHIL